MTLGASSRSCAILVVDDDAELAETLKELLQREGYDVEVAVSATEALLRQQHRPDFCIAVVDLVMPVTGGLELMEKLLERNPHLAVIIMTGYGTIETAVEAMKKGAEDYITKPFDQEAIRKKVARLAEIFELRERVAHLEANLERYSSFESFIYASPVMQHVIERARTVAESDASILVLGETGTGKELMARAIHEAGSRSRRPFLAVNCGALPPELMESELFGHRRGAFTGAHDSTPGIFLAAAGGTVFLDEIGEMPKEAQVKLLRVLQEGELRPVGGTKSVRVDTRIIAASNRSLAELRAECLREDFYYRIATVVIEIPPLRSRSEDILGLAQHFAERLSRRFGRKIALARPALQLLLRYPFPGNVRELENLLEGFAALSRDNPQTITDKDLKPLLSEPALTQGLGAEGEPALALEEVERLAIQRALRMCGGNRTKAASQLGISRDTLYRRLRQFRQS